MLVSGSVFIHTFGFDWWYMLVNIPYEKNDSFNGWHNWSLKNVLWIRVLSNQVVCSGLFPVTLLDVLSDLFRGCWWPPFGLSKVHLEEAGKRQTSYSNSAWRLAQKATAQYHMAGVQNSRSKGLYKVGPIGIEKLILHLRYEAGPIGNHAVHKLGASIALAWR